MTAGSAQGDLAAQQTRTGPPFLTVQGTARGQRLIEAEDHLPQLVLVLAAGDRGVEVPDRDQQRPQARKAPSSRVPSPNEVADAACSRASASVAASSS